MEEVKTHTQCSSANEGEEAKTVGVKLKHRANKNRFRLLDTDKLTTLPGNLAGLVLRQLVF
jgi:hypothetical protein